MIRQRTVSLAGDTRSGRADLISFIIPSSYGVWRRPGLGTRLAFSSPEDRAWSKEKYSSCSRIVSRLAYSRWRVSRLPRAGRISPLARTCSHRRPLQTLRARPWRLRPPPLPPSQCKRPKRSSVTRPRRLNSPRRQWPRRAQRRSRGGEKKRRRRAAPRRGPTVTPARRRRATTNCPRSSAAGRAAAARPSRRLRRRLHPPILQRLLRSKSVRRLNRRARPSLHRRCSRS